ncbi:SIMPL domain-containing protein [Patescibacteria group bacterium]|nr:SIMPL domain-containing protein [Patescibacteria group bacterium]
MKEIFKKINIIYLVLVILLLAGVGYSVYRYYVPSKRTITVTGTSKGDYANQVSTYYLTLEYHNKEKDKAVEELNEKSKEAVEKIKEFGIDSNDIKTQNMNVYQREEAYLDQGVTKYKSDEWYASYSIEVTLRDLSRSIELTGLLTTIESASMWGPNLRIDDSETDSDELLISAMEDARQKAERMAKSMGGRVGKVLKIDEGMTSGDYYGLMRTDVGLGSGEGAPIEPGTSSVSKSVTVTFELR